mgnify:CR=1 FL=1
MQSRADEYIVPGSINLTTRKDVFVNRTVTRTVIRSQNRGSPHGGGGGGTTVHSNGFAGSGGSYVKSGGRKQDHKEKSQYFMDGFTRRMVHGGLPGRIWRQHIMYYTRDSLNKGNKMKHLLQKIGRWNIIKMIMQTGIPDNDL